MLRLVLLHLIFGGAWVGAFMLLPADPNWLLTSLLIFVGGPIALFGPGFLMRR